MGVESPVSPVTYGLELLRSVRWWWIPVPLLITAAAYLVFRFAIDDFETLVDIKQLMEAVAIVVTCGAALVAAVRCAVERRGLALWLLIFAALFAFREWHIVRWASTLTYVGLFALLLAAWRNDEPVGRHLATHPMSTWLVLAFVSYATTRPFDMDFLQVLSPEDNPALAPLQFVEEVVENVGHLCVLVLVIVARDSK